MKAREIAFKILCDIEENNNYSNIAINKHFKNLKSNCFYNFLQSIRRFLNFNASLPTDAEPTKPQPIITAFFNNHFLLCNNLLLFNSSLHVLRNNSVDGYILDISQVPLFLPQHVHSYGIPIP